MNITYIYFCLVTCTRNNSRKSLSQIIGRRLGEISEFNLKGREHLADISVYGEKILQLVFKM